MGTKTESEKKSTTPEPSTSEGKNPVINCEKCEEPTTSSEFLDLIVIDDSTQYDTTVCIKQEPITIEDVEEDETPTKEVPEEPEKLQQLPTTSNEPDKEQPESVAKEANESVCEETPKATRKKDVPNKPDEGDSLIITADDVELDNDVNEQVRVPKDKASKSSGKQHAKAEKKPAKTEPKQTSSKNAEVSANRCVWAGNVSKTSKASDLKQLFSKCGKVLVTKIVTDGKRCFGYVTFDRQEDAFKSLKVLKNVVFDGAKLSLALTRPTCEETKEKEKSADRESLSAVKKKERRSASRVRSVRNDDDDPLTSTFPDTKRRSEKERSRYLREKRQSEKIKRRVYEQVERQLEEKHRQRRREEEHRELERKLREQRRQLERDREIFERERKEMLRLEEERRKIEEEKFAILREKKQLEEQLRLMRKIESKMRKEPDCFPADKKVTVKSKVCDPPPQPQSKQDRYTSDTSPIPPPPPRILINTATKHKRNYCAAYSSIRRRESSAFNPPKKAITADKFDLRPKSHRDYPEYAMPASADSSWKRPSTNLIEPKREPWAASSSFADVGGCTGFQQPAPMRYEQQQTQMQGFASGRSCEEYYYHHRSPHHNGVGGGGSEYSRCGQYQSNSRKY